MMVGATYLRRRLCLVCEKFTIHAGKTVVADKTYHCNVCQTLTTIKEGEKDVLGED